MLSATGSWLSSPGLTASGSIGLLKGSWLKRLSGLDSFMSSPTEFGSPGEQRDSSSCLVIHLSRVVYSGFLELRTEPNPFRVGSVSIRKSRPDMPSGQTLQRLTKESFSASSRSFCVICKNMATIPSDLFLMFILGLVFAWQTPWDRKHPTGQAADKIGNISAILRSKYFLLAILYLTIFCLPLAIYCYFLYPDWCWMYFIDSKTAPTYLIIFAYVSYYIVFILGYLIGFLFEKEKKGCSFRRAILPAVVIFLIFAIVTFKRLFYVGSMDEFYSNSLRSIPRVPYLFVILVLGFGAAIFFLLYILSYFGKQVDVKWSEEQQRKLAQRKKVVSIVKLDKKGIRESVEESLNLWNGTNYLKNLIEEKGGNIIIKPNLAGGGKDKKGTQTSPEVLSAVIDLLRELEKDVKIKIVESGSIFWWNLEPLLKGGYQNLFEEKKVEFVDLGKCEQVEYDFGGRLGREKIPKLLLEKNILIDIPVPKTHAFYRMSGAIKNLFGLLPVPFKLFRYHGIGLDYEGRIFIDIYRNFPPDLVIVDGIISGEGHGPDATPKPTGFIITSDEAMSVDLVLSEIMHYQRKDIPYINALLGEGMKCEYEVLGYSIEAIKPKEWRHTNKFIGMLITYVRIFLEHIKTYFGK